MECYACNTKQKPWVQLDSNLQKAELRSPGDTLRLARQFMRKFCSIYVILSFRDEREAGFVRPELLQAPAFFLIMVTHSGRNVFSNLFKMTSGHICRSSSEYCIQGSFRMTTIQC